MSEGHFEAVKYAYRQSKDGFVLSFVVHPNDMPDDMATAPIGERFMIGYALLKDGGPPKPAGGTTPKHSAEGQPSSREAPPAVPLKLPPPSRHGPTLSQRAWALCINDDFRSWLNEMNEHHGKQWGDTIAFDAIAADTMLKRMLDIQSKKELDTNNSKANEFRFHLGGFNVWRQARAHGRAA